MVRILVSSRAKLPMARPDKQSMSDKKVRLGIYRVQIHHQVRELISQNIRTLDTASDWLIEILGTVDR